MNLVDGWLILNLRLLEIKIVSIFMKLFKIELLLTYSFISLH